MPLFTDYQNTQAQLYLSGEMDSALAIEVHRTLSDIRTYWHYPQVTLTIDSPGGDLAALFQILADVRACRANSLRIHTQALMRAGSAAAMLLALGDVGQRRVHAHTELLFHRSRAITNAERVITARHAWWMAHQLQTRDEDLIDRLIDHLLAGFDGMRGLAAAGLARLPTSHPGHDGTKNAGCPPPMRVQAEDSTKSEALNELQSIYRAMLEGGEGLPRYRDFLAAVFDEDQPISARQAHCLMLIDHSEGTRC